MNYFFRRFFCFLLFCALQLWNSAFSQTYVSGGIYTNTTWSLANSPYFMTGPVVVFPGKTLTIEPGVEVRVKFNGIPNTGYMHYLEIRGKLQALGTKEQPIIFHGDTLPEEYSWLGINVRSTQGAQINMDYFELSNSYYGIYADEQGAPEWNLHHCTFRRNNYAIQPFGPLNFYNCLFEYNGQAIASGWQINHQIKVKGSAFLNNFSCNGFQTYLSVDSCIVKKNVNGIWYAQGPVSRTYFENNTFAIYAFSGTISDCIFKNNHRGLVEFLGAADNCSFSGNGIAAELASGGSVTGCSFQNDTVATAYASSLNSSSVLPVFSDNKICGSLRYYVENKSDLSISLDQNCFCETDSALIESKIFDGYDDFTKGLLNYTIYDLNCQDILRQVIKFNPLRISGAAKEKPFLYPVPAADVIRISIPKSMQNTLLRLALFDSRGNQIGEERLLSAAAAEWDLSKVSAGLYSIRMQGETSAVLRFIKE
jgi:hypothetical protein